MGRLLRWLAVITLVATACSIQAPVEVVSSEGGQAGSSNDELATGDGASDLTGVDTGTDGASGAGAAGGGARSGGGGATSGASSAARGAANGATDIGVSADKIRVGSLFALSGPVSSISAPLLYGVSAYFRKINAAGGVGGRKVELVYYDDGYDPQRGVGLIRRLIEQDKVFSLVTVPSSSSLEAATQYIESQKVPVIGTSGLVETQFKAPMQFPVGASTVVATHAGLKYIHDRYKPKNVAIIYVDLLAGEYARKATEGAASRLGFEVCSKQKVPLSQPDYGPVWLNVRSDCGDTVDYVLLAVDPSSAIKAITAAKNQRFKPAKGWGGGATLFLDLVVKGVGAYGVGLGASTSFIPPVGKYLNEPAVKDYVETVRKYSPSGIDVTNPYLEGGYVGAALAVEAFKRAGANLTRASVLNILNNLENWTIGLSRPLTFKGGNKYANNSLLMAEIADENGKLQYKIISDFIPDPWPGQDTSL